MRPDPRLAEMRAAWAAKPALRAVYADYYRRLAAELAPGPTLEVGGGSGNLKEHRPDVLSMDLLPAPWLDLIADAHALPFADRSLANLVLVDVLHHLERPPAFLREAARVLRPGGRIAMLEPAITPVSWLFYNFLHPEPVALSADPLDETPPRAGRDPFEANQAVPTLLFGRHRRRFEAAFPDFVLRRLSRFSFVAYPLTGGFRPWSLLPGGAVRPLLACERAAAPLLGRLAAFRLLAVLEKR